MMDAMQGNGDVTNGADLYKLCGQPTSGDYANPMAEHWSSGIGLKVSQHLLVRHMQVHLSVHRRQPRVNVRRCGLRHVVASLVRL